MTLTMNPQEFTVSQYRDTIAQVVAKLRRDEAMSPGKKRAF